MRFQRSAILTVFICLSFGLLACSGFSSDEDGSDGSTKTDSADPTPDTTSESDASEEPDTNGQMEGDTESGEEDIASDDGSETDDDGGDSDKWTGWYSVQEHRESLPEYNQEERKYISESKWCTDMSAERAEGTPNFIGIQKNGSRYRTLGCPEKSFDTCTSRYGNFFDSPVIDADGLFVSNQSSSTPSTELGECLCTTELNRLQLENGELTLTISTRGYVTDQSCDSCYQDKDIYSDDKCVHKEEMVATPAE